MGLQSFYLNIIAGRGGVLASLARGVLSVLSWPYGLAVDWRNRRFDSGRREAVRLDVPVISVGNITTGGTGKTPLVIDLAQRLIERGFKPAIVSRGYKSVDGGLGDELTMISRRLPKVQCVANPDRVAGARGAVAAGADVVLLDDAFQHRRVARDLNIAVVDATNPFGFGHLLPRGLLRERPSSLSRADVVLVSRADLVEQDNLSATVERIQTLTPDTPIVFCVHRPAGVCELKDQGEAETLRRAVLFAAIGNPAAFEKTVRTMGVDVVQTRWWPDHHVYNNDDIAELCRMTSEVEHDGLLTTEKDAVKLLGADFSGVSVFVLRIDVAYLNEGDDVMNAQLDQVLVRSNDG